jgi:hypothetical protein
MALARIITRSHICSRQLAFDLIARGYAVEIVSPDSIPDNLADLELRVEEDPGNQLVASVEAHNGGRTAALEFLHYLKAPMPDFIRRPPPDPHEAVHLPEAPVSFKVERAAEEVELPVNAPQPAPGADSETSKILHDSKPDSQPAAKPDSEGGVRLVLPPDPLLSLPAEAPNQSASASSTIARPIAPPAAVRPAVSRPVAVAPTTALPRDVRSPWPQPFDHSSGAFRNVAPTLASMVLIMALGLGFSMRRGNKTAAHGSGATPTASMSRASIVPEKDSGKDHEQVSAWPVAAPATNAEGHLDNAPKQSPVAKIDNPAVKVLTEAPTKPSTEALTKTVGTRFSSRHGDGLIARDTVTYLDQHTSDQASSRAKTSQPSTLPQPISGKHNGVIAENTVTVPNNNSAPKAAKQDSGIKRYSDLK